MPYGRRKLREVSYDYRYSEYSDSYYVTEEWGLDAIKLVIREFKKGKAYEDISNVLESELGVIKSPTSIYNKCVRHMGMTRKQSRRSKPK